jgi:large subunit ribosomal protein L13
MCTEVARILRGKHKPIFATHMDTGDHVVIVNASKVVLTRGKAEVEMVHNYSGYPGGLRSETYGSLLRRKPEDAIRRTVRGMLPKGPLGRQMIKKLKVHAGPTHDHQAQKPTKLDLPGARAR